MYFYFGHKNSLFGHNRFFTLFFSMKVEESEKNRPSKLHNRFQRYTSLIKSNLTSNFEEDRHNSAGIEIQADVS
jgi:hypothetical protein